MIFAINSTNWRCLQVAQQKLCQGLEDHEYKSEKPSSLPRPIMNVYGSILEIKGLTFLVTGKCSKTRMLIIS